MSYRKWVPVFLVGLLMLSYQNCSVYKSDGFDEFELALSRVNTGDCLPFMDVNEAALIMGVSNGLDVITQGSSTERSCSFRDKNNTLNAVDLITCSITTASGTGLSIEASYSNEIYSIANPLNTSLTDAEKQNQVEAIIQNSTPVSEFEVYVNPSTYTAYVNGTLQTLSQDNLSEEMYGYSYEKPTSSGSLSVDTIFKFVAGSRGLDISNPCSGGACVECKFVAQNKSRISFSNSESQSIRSTLARFVSRMKLIER